MPWIGLAAEKAVQPRSLSAVKIRVRFSADLMSTTVVGETSQVKLPTAFW